VKSDGAAMFPRRHFSLSRRPKRAAASFFKEMLRFPSWPGVVPAIHVLLAEE
jgi:hypothetical protein